MPAATRGQNWGAGLMLLGMFAYIVRLVTQSPAWLIVSMVLAISGLFLLHACEPTRRTRGKRGRRDA